METMKKKILVVDDDPKHLETTRELLEDEGYEVITRSQGFGSTFLAMSSRPDLILLDINMPGVSGEMIAKVLLSEKKTKDTPIVFYSSNDEDSLREAVSKFGASGYICKGDVSGLKRKVSKYLSMQGV